MPYQLKIPDAIKHGTTLLLLLLLLLLLIIIIIIYSSFAPHGA
jgi:cytochrome bd-type quinol oxidase subunit 2